MKTQFQDTQFFIDADVTYAMRNTSSSSFILYDLHNKGLQLGGKLNITADRELSCDKHKCELERYLTDFFTRKPLQHRRSLTGLTMKAAAVVCNLFLVIISSCFNLESV